MTALEPGSTFGQERFVFVAFVAKHVLDACFLGGILSSNSNEISVKCGDVDMIYGSKKDHVKLK